MKIALASPPFPKSINDGIEWIQKFVKEAIVKEAEIICFPESYLPGYPGMKYPPTDRSPEKLQNALDKVCEIALANSITIIVPMDWHTPDGLVNMAHVISKNGEILGYQTKNQLDPSEDTMWVPGTERKIFEVDGVKFGITICHEGFRYPESVRWAAQQGAHIVFHPHFTGRNSGGIKLTEWGAKENPYYEKAMIMRAIENTIYFASCNYTSNFSESASSIIAPDGSCIAYRPYGETGIIVADIDPALATGFLAKRFKNKLYSD